MHKKMGKDSNKSILNHSKAYDFASLMDPMLISSSNYLSTLNPTELKNCVALHKQSIALQLSNSNAQHNQSIKR